MADPQPEAQPSPDITSLVGPVDDKSIAGLTTGLKSVQAAKVAQDESLSRQSDAQASHDKVLRDRAFAAEGVAANEVPKPWDAEKEHRKWESNPIEGFGSAGGLFAMVASAFTKAPMENAINGMAGAINSIKEGNEAGYQRAYDAFKTNVKLADQRFKMQHDLYQDALSIGNADMAASQAKFHNAAIRFGDRKALMLMEAGMYPELYELIDARSKARDQMMKTADAVDLHTAQKAAVDSIKMNPPNTGDPTQDKMMLAAQIQRVYDGGGKYGTAEQEAVGRYVQSNTNKNPQEFADGLAKIHQDFSAKAPNIQGYQEAKQAWHDAHPGEQLTPDEDAKMLQAFGLTGVHGAGGANKTPLTNDRQIQQDSEAYKARMATEHPDWGPDKLDQARDRYVKDRKIATVAPTAHDVHQDDIAYQKAERMETAMDEMDQLLLKHKLITGLGGTLTRPLEAIGNVLGSNETDRKQFQRVATELKEWGQSVLNDRSGRPLSSETHDAAVIFAGINPGDTGANTLRAITELRPVIKTIKSQIKARGQGRGPVSGGQETDPPAEDPKGKDAPWMNDPVKGSDKRSEVSRPTGPVMSDADPEPIRAGARYAQANTTASGTASLPTFSIDNLRPYRNKEVPPGEFPRVAVDNQENRVVVDKSYGILDEFGYRKIGELMQKYKLKPGEKVMLIDKQGHQFGYKRDDQYEGGYTTWFPYEEDPGS